MAFFKKKTWKDRVTEYPTRRTLTKSDGSTELVTVSRSEGNVSQEGDAFNAATMNDLEDRVESGFDAVNNDLDQCSFERKEDGVYITYTPPGGADSVTKKLGSGTVKRVLVEQQYTMNAQNQTYSFEADVSAYDKDGTFTADNFATELSWNGGNAHTGKSEGSPLQISYNPTTKRVTYGFQVTSVNDWVGILTKCYLFYCE